VQVTYTNVVLTITSATGETDSESIPCTFTRTYFPQAL
jgi:hypothetical protein